MKTIFFTVFGDPKGKARPKFAKIGNFMKAYQPREQHEAENYIRMSYLEAAKGEYFFGPIALKVMAFISIPKSTSKIKRTDMLTGLIRPVIKPDYDNIVKSVADALNKVAYEDDRQIVSGCFEKYYSERPRTEIEIREI